MANIGGNIPSSRERRPETFQFGSFPEGVHDHDPLRTEHHLGSDIPLEEIHPKSRLRCSRRRIRVGMGALEVSEQPCGIYLALKILYERVIFTYNYPPWSCLYPSKTDVTKGLQSLVALS